MTKCSIAKYEGDKFKLLALDFEEKLSADCKALRRVVKERLDKISDKKHEHYWKENERLVDDFRRRMREEFNKKAGRARHERVAEGRGCRASGG